jgi:hypothetical protein
LIAPFADPFKPAGAVANEITTIEPPGSHAKTLLQKAMHKVKNENIRLFEFSS